MDRRAFLGVVSATVALAGCTGSGPPGSTTPPAASTPTITDQKFARTGDCEDPGAATVSFPDDVVVTGCISGPDGCAAAALDSVDYDGAEDTLYASVGIVDTREPDEVCIEAQRATSIVYRAYELRIGFDNGLPGTVVVVHDGVEGRIEAARVER